MKQNNIISATLLTTALFFANSAVFAHDMYEVTITNITKSSVFTPIMVASHRKGVEIFKLGHPASPELGRIAEGGDIAPMTDHLSANPKVIDVKDSGGPLMPGHSVTVKVSAAHGAKYISAASMILPSNDAFIALNGVKAPNHRYKSAMYHSPGYDAGTETNDELCIHIPGPHCVDSEGNQGQAFSPEDDGEGYVYISNGINGGVGGDLSPATYDWHNPTALITIKRVKKNKYY